MEDREGRKSGVRSDPKEKEKKSKRNALHTP